MLTINVKHQVAIMVCVIIVSGSVNMLKFLSYKKKGQRGVINCKALRFIYNIHTFLFMRS